MGVSGLRLPGTGDPPSSAGHDSGTEPLPYVEVNRSWGAATLDLAGGGLAGARRDPHLHDPPS